MAGGTPLHSDLDAPHVHILVQWGPEVILLILVLIRCEPEPGEGGRKVTSLAGESFLDLCQPTHQDPTLTGSFMPATHTLVKVSRFCA